MNKLPVEVVLIKTYYAWAILALSILAEVVGTIALRYSEGFTRPVPALASGFCYLLAVWFMAIVIKHIEVGLTYAVWAAGGIALTALIGVVFFGESTSPWKFFGIALIIAGVVVSSLSEH